MRRLMGRSRPHACWTFKIRAQRFVQVLMILLLLEAEAGMCRSIALLQATGSRCLVETKQSRSPPALHLSASAIWSRRKNAECAQQRAGPTLISSQTPAERLWTAGAAADLQVQVEPEDNRVELLRFEVNSAALSEKVTWIIRL